MKIAVLGDCQNVAPSLADGDSLAAEVVVFTKPFADAGEAIRSLAGSACSWPCGSGRDSPPRSWSG